MRGAVHQEPESAAVLVTIEEAARRLSIGRSHIYEVMRHGRLRSVRIGRSRRILERDLEAFIRQLLDGPEDAEESVSRVRGREPVKGVPLRSGRR